MSHDDALKYEQSTHDNRRALPPEQQTTGSSTIFGTSGNDSLVTMIADRE